MNLAQFDALLTSVDEAIVRGDASLAHKAAGEAARIALKLDDTRPGQRVGEALERLLRFEEAGRLLARAGVRRKAEPLPEWAGEPLADRSLLVTQRMRHVGSAIRLGHLAEVAGLEARRCAMVVDPRLAPLFARSFRHVEPLTRVPEPIDGFDLSASLETLMHLRARGPAEIRAGFRPLVADGTRTATLRHSRAAPGPTIGLNWASSNERKDLPDLSAWIAPLRRLGATYVSLQYGQAAAAAATLRDAGLDLRDEGIDPLADLDGAAAQIASVDGVLTISNTSAHLAGALGTPTVVMLDAKQHLTWPAFGDATPWYPRLRLVRLRTSGWIATLDEAVDALAAMMKGEVKA